MPGVDLSQLSSNWKKLQSQLKSDPAQKVAHHDLKRKRAEEQAKRRAPNGLKKTKLSPNVPARGGRRAKMGFGDSKPAPPLPNHTTLTQTHDIAPEDLAAAYGHTPTTGTSHVYQDDINAGLHPTHRAGKYVALDCEMVGTGPPPHADHLLARASLVNFDGAQLYDSYVQPPPGAAVRDYRTPVSGIEARHLAAGSARPFAEVQRAVANLLAGRVLVGHALPNDLRVLQLDHPRRDRRDTSRHPPFRVQSRGRPPALRNLARSELGLIIQTGAHSSVEDARAAMMLYKKEKRGFEDENRRNFGARGTRLEGNGAGKPRSGASVSGSHNAPDAADEEDEEEEEDGEDGEFLDGELDELETVGSVGHASAHRTTTTPARKNRKKKRTKRK